MPDFGTALFLGTELLWHSQLRPLVVTPNFYKLTGAGGPKGRRAQTWAMKMPKAWPMFASALNAKLGSGLVECAEMPMNKGLSERAAMA